MSRNPIEDDESPRTCHDCNADFGMEAFEMQRRSPIGLVTIYLCRECFGEYTDAQHGIDDEDAAYDLWREMTR